MGDYDNTHKQGSKYINIAAVFHGLLEYEKGCKLIEFKKTINSNHRGYLINLDIVEYFDHSNSIHNKTNNIMLNLSKKSYRKKFVQTIEKYIDRLNIEDILDEIDKQWL